MAKYTVPESESMYRDNPAAMRKEYSRLRDIAQKRIGRLEGSEYSGSKAYTTHQKGFAKLKDIDPRDLPKAFSELSKFVESRGSSVTGQSAIKRKTIQRWREQGLNLNSKNYDKTMRIMEEMRRRKIVYGSDKAVELADRMLELDENETEAWLEHLETLLQHADELEEIPEDAGEEIDSIIQEIGW